MSDKPICEICGGPMPEGEEMFKYHGHSGPCPKPPLPKPAVSDIVKRLRAFSDPDAAEAADEIERLRAALKPFVWHWQGLQVCKDLPNARLEPLKDEDFINAVKALEGKQ